MQLTLLLHFLTAPAAETSNDLSSWVGEELNVSDRPELTSAKVVVSGGKSMIMTALARREIVPNTGANATKFFTLVTKS